MYPDWDAFGPGNPYASIEPLKMFTFRKETHPQSPRKKCQASRVRFIGLSRPRALSEAFEALAAAGVRAASTNVRDSHGEVMLDLGLSPLDEATGEAVMATLGFRVDRTTA